MKGVGPALEKKLKAAGVTSFSQIVNMSADEISALEEELNLSGRFERDGWIEQAKTFAAEG